MEGRGSKISLSVKINVRLVKMPLCSDHGPSNLRASMVLNAESVQQGKELGGRREG